MAQQEIGCVLLPRFTAFQSLEACLQGAARHASREQHPSECAVGVDAGSFQPRNGQSAEQLQHHPLEQASSAQRRPPARQRQICGQRLPCGANPVDLMLFGPPQEAVQNDGRQVNVLMAVKRNALLSGEGPEAVDLMVDGSFQLRQQSLAMRRQQ